MNEKSKQKIVPLLLNKYFDQPTVFTPESLLRETRRQKSIPEGRVPDICILDPDGDIVRNLLSEKKMQPNLYWACYHTELLNFVQDDLELISLIAGVWKEHNSET